MDARIALFGHSATTDELRVADLGMEITWLQDPQPDIPADIAVIAETLTDPLGMTQATQKSDIDRPVLILRERQMLSSCQAEVITAAGIGTQVEVLDAQNSTTVVNSLQRSLSRSLQRQRFSADLTRANDGLNARPAYLPQNQVMLSDLLEALPVVVLAIDTNQRIMYANAAAQQFNLTHFDALGQPWFAMLSKQAAQHGAELVSGALKDRRRQSVLLDHHHPVLGLRHLELTVIPNTDLTRPDTAVLLLHDVTAQRQADELREQSLQLLEDANRAKSHFLATMSHEIRTPLHGVLALLELLSKTSLDTEQRRHVRMMGESAESLKSLISDILDISKIEAGAVEILAEPFHLRDLVEKSIVMFATQALNKCLILRAQCPTGLSGVVGDFTRLRQILSNLISNAVKCTPAGSVLVQLSAVPNGEGQLMLEIRVEDTGIGLSNDEQVQIFQRFSQTHSSIQLAQGGTGLGLSISRGLVELMGGTLTCASVPGEGSCFTIRLTLPCTDELGPAEIRDSQLQGLRIHLGLTDDSESDQLAEDFTALGCEIVANESPHLWVETTQEPREDISPVPVLKVHNNQAFDRLVSRPVILDEWHQIFRQFRGLSNEEGDDGRAETHTDFPRMRILVAEDNPINRTIIKHQLSGLGCDVKVVDDGAQALRVLANEKFDLLITDIRMPVMSGHVLVTKLRKDAATNRRGQPLPVLAMTASAEKSELELCMQNGIDEVLTKPLTLEQLTRALKRWLPTKAQDT